MIKMYTHKWFQSIGKMAKTTPRLCCAKCGAFVAKDKPCWRCSSMDRAVMQPNQKQVKK